jgi:hypothetical protein
MSHNPPMKRASCVNLMEVTEKICISDDDVNESQNYLVRKMLLTPSIVEDSH